MPTETLSATLPGAVESLVMAVLQDACERRLRLVTAESCTGGLLASVLTDVDGRAHAFERGFVTYSDEAKHELLGVPLELIHRDGAVSESVARAMAQGGLRRSRGDIALAVTGFAGRGGAGDEPGLVHFALCRSQRPTIHCVKRFGDIGRGPVRLACLREGLKLFQAAMG